MPIQHMHTAEGRLEELTRRMPKLPKQIWADYDPTYPAHLRWGLYRTKDEQQGNRPDLQPIRLLVTFAPEQAKTVPCSKCGSPAVPFNGVPALCRECTADQY